MAARRRGIAERGAVLICGGPSGVGTLSEIALALRNGRPAVGIRTWA